MEALYIKLYQKYSKLKDNKENELDRINQEQELNFFEHVTAADKLIKQLTAENKRLTENVDELRKEVVFLRTAKYQEVNELQDQLMEERRKNTRLSAEVEQLRDLQQERMSSSTRSDRSKEQLIKSNQQCPSVSQGQTTGSSARMTRKRARLMEDTGSPLETPAVGHVQLLTGKELSRDRSKCNGTSVHPSQPECCGGNIINGGLSNCVFQVLVECLIGMKVSIAERPEGKCIRAVHQSSGYSFNLTWVNKSASNEVELMYHVSSLGTYVNVAPEWMREVIVFSTTMCPIFFERLSQVIKQ